MIKLKNNSLKSVFKAFVSGILVSTCVSLPILNANAAYTSGVKRYFNYNVGGTQKYYYNYNTIYTGKNSSNQIYASAALTIGSNDGHQFIAGEVGVLPTLYNSSGAIVYQLPGFVYNPTGGITSFTDYAYSTSVVNGNYYYSRGISAVYVGSSDYEWQASAASPLLGNFT